MKKLPILILFVASLFVFNGCDEETPSTSDLNYVTFGGDMFSAGVDVGGSTTVDIPVYTTEIAGSAKTFNLTVDGSDAATGSYNVPASVVIEAGTNKGTLSVTLSDVDLGIGVNIITIDFEEVDGLINGGSTAIEYTQNCTEVTATLDISFDYYSSETGWYIVDSLGGVVLSNQYGSDGIWTTSENLSLCSGRDYTLVFTDAYGDGMDDGTNLGSYTLTIGGAVKVTGGGGFGASESNAFDTK